MNRSPSSGTLYLIPTPIGNIGDLSARAIETLGQVDLVAAEDTRETLKLLKRIGLTKRLVSYHDHNEQQRAPQLIERLQQGERVALVSDAGTPLLSDPGYRLVRLAIAGGIRVTSLPGPSAAITALIASGLPADRFCFAGFLPRRGAQRLTRIRELRAYHGTLILFEAPHRVLDSLAALEAELGDRQATLGWNLTKESERYLRGSLSTLRAELASWEYLHGEITLVLAGAGPEDDRAEQWHRADRLIQLLQDQGVQHRGICQIVGEACELPKHDLYQRILAMAR
ncbi:MAG: 16S rRNA (cytidine(1402)-2'-O)-methyltransferase [Dehalococcoidia bacterium]